MTDRLKDKVCLIIGATSGIGKAMTKLFAKEGGQVVFTGRREEKGKALEEEVNEAGYKARFFQADATSAEDNDKLISFMKEEYGRIDVLCNNSGILMNSAFEDIDLENEFDKMVNVNVRAQFDMIQRVIPIMRENGGGSIVNTASVGAIQALPYHVTYATTKAAVKHMTESLAVELAGDKIRVNNLCPGLTRSEMVTEGSDFENNVLPNVPLGRPASADEIANGALFLASDESSYVTGMSMVMDGGLTL